ncbi:MAG TPA: response regulator [Clostridia bacterium]|nr:response regulator [Clostridia bacterium]
MGRVLIVNDSRFESMVLRDLLSQLGYNVSITDEYNALKQVQDFSPDVVLTNYVMKETFGDQLIERIKARHPGVLCVLTSNSGIDPNGLKSRRVDAIVRTPVSKEELESVFKRIYNGRNASPVNEPEITEIKATMKKWKNKLKQ